MSNREFRVYGPPGTGKTTYLAKQVKIGAQHYGSSNVLVCSLTKTAAQEVAGRDTAIDQRQIGTLHAHGLRSLMSGGGVVHNGTIADSPKGIGLWNAECRPIHRLSGGKAPDPDDPLDTGANIGVGKDGEQPGDPLFHTYSIYRHQMVPRSNWSPTVRTFAEDWENWKRRNTMIDFTDMIEVPIDSVDVAPGNPHLLFADEAQDMSRLEMSLVRKWAARTDTLTVVGDPDQNLYEWRGSDANVFNEGAIPQEHKRVLAQSYRVPKLVHARAMQWIARNESREKITYHPRDFDGRVTLSNSVWKLPGNRMMYEINERAESGKTVMVLASCAYMLNPTIEELRNSGIPFHNPYRLRDPRWNPMRGKARDSVLAFLRPSRNAWGDHARMWNVGEVKLWASGLPTKMFQKEGKKLLERLSDDEQIVTVQHMMMFFPEQILSKIMDCDYRWWRDAHLVSRKTKSLEYAVELVSKNPALLTKEPKVIIGTIHSVKGGEADSVLLYPDLSQAGMTEWLTPKRRDAVVRTFYVGMTRAKEELIIGSACGSAVPL